MKLSTFCFEPEDGWSVDGLPDLDSPNTLALVFGPSDLADLSEALNQLTTTYPQSAIVGCSTAGEIFDTAVSDGTLSVAVAKFEDTALATAYAEISSPDDSFTAGQSIAESLDGPLLRAVLVLSDGLNVNGSELVRGLNDKLPDSVVITGGLAGDGDRFKHTWVLKDSKPQSGVITAVGFYGEKIRVGHGSRGGWDIFGPERCVTRSDGNVLYELDGQPALELYKQYLGERAAELPAHGVVVSAGAADR